MEKLGCSHDVEILNARMDGLNAKPEGSLLYPRTELNTELSNGVQIPRDVFFEGDLGGMNRTDQ